MISTSQLIIIAIIALIIFGPKRLPELGKTVGKALKNFKDSMGGSEDVDYHSSSPVEDRRADGVSGSVPRGSEATDQAAAGEPDRKEPQTSPETRKDGQ